MEINKGISFFFSLYIKIFRIVISFHLIPRKYWRYWGFKIKVYNGNDFYNIGFGRIALISIQKINNRIMHGKEKERYELSKSILEGKIT
jgi:hypothetical protein